MDAPQQIRILQLTYAAQLADATVQYGRAGVLERVTEERRAQRVAGSSGQAAQLGVTTPAEVFTVSAELFGCADWIVTTAPGEGFAATATRCVLCAMVKKAGGESPCRLFCLDPIEAMVRGLEPEAAFEVQETLHDGERCRVRVTRAR